MQRDDAGGGEYDDRDYRESAKLTRDTVRAARLRLDYGGGRELDRR